MRQGEHSADLAVNLPSDAAKTTIVPPSVRAQACSNCTGPAVYMGNAGHFTPWITVPTLNEYHYGHRQGKGSPYSISERRVPELIPVLCSQPAGDVSHKPGGRLQLLSARPAVTLATLKRAGANFAAW